MKHLPHSYTDVVVLRIIFVVAMSTVVYTNVIKPNPNHDITHIHEWTWLDATLSGDLVPTVLQEFGFKAGGLYEPGIDVVFVRGNYLQAPGNFICGLPAPPPPPRSIPPDFETPPQTRW